MAIRIIRSLLCLACLCSTGVGFAQLAPYGSGGAGAYSSSPYAASQGYSPTGYSGYTAPPQGVMPMNYERPLPGSPEAIANGMYIPDSQVLPTDPGNDRAFDRVFRKVFDRSWIRLEALHWDVDSPGSHVLGANPIADQVGDPIDPTVIRQIFDPSGTSIGFGFTPTLRGMSFNDNNGIRGTFGREDSWGSYQLSFWGIEEASETQRFDDLFGGTNFFLTTTLDIDNNLTNYALLADVYENVAYETSLWGANSEFRVNTGQWPDGMNVQWVGGMNFTQLHESMRINTGFNNQGLNTLLESRIESNIMNNMFGPVVGLNVDFETPWITFGITPKAILSVNQIRYSIRTEDLAYVGDSGKSERNDYELSPILTLAVYAKLKINDSFSLYASWDGTYLSRIARSANTINYNDNSATARTDLGINRNLNSFTMSGISVGGELLLY
ncbi:MAG: BBP7 family outer membrane beta-barrel protein [Planctomycetaceae bacterium]|nr:BBP7 family outer membrane beta-barrel protein [Planctomycetaceae bacterium]